jgi:hypothetical protein
MHSEHERAMPAQPAAGCHAVARCDGAACFQVRVEASGCRRPVLHWANACAAHIGDLVEGVKTWAHDGNLTGATLTVLVVDPAAESRRAAGGEPGPLWPGFAFSVLPLVQPARQ